MPYFTVKKKYFKRGKPQTAGKGKKNQIAEPTSDNTDFMNKKREAVKPKG